MLDAYVLVAPSTVVGACVAVSVDPDAELAAELDVTGTSALLPRRSVPTDEPPDPAVVARVKAPAVETLSVEVLAADVLGLEKVAVEEFVAEEFVAEEPGVDTPALGAPARLNPALVTTREARVIVDCVAVLC